MAVIPAALSSSNIFNLKFSQLHFSFNWNNDVAMFVLTESLKLTFGSQQESPVADDILLVRENKQDLFKVKILKSHCTSMGILW